MRKLLIFLLSALALFTSTAFAADTNIGIVDMRQVLQKSPQMAAMQTKLRNEFGKRDKEIQAAQQQLQKDADDLNRNAAVMDQAKKDALTAKIQTEQNTIRTMQANFQRDLYAKQNEEMQSILTQVQSIISKIAQQKSLNLVITKDAVEYANGNTVDITPDVIHAIR